jgi:hypothetical protein
VIDLTTTTSFFHDTGEIASLDILHMRVHIIIIILLGEDLMHFFRKVMAVGHCACIISRAPTARPGKYGTAKTGLHKG